VLVDTIYQAMFVLFVKLISLAAFSVLPQLTALSVKVDTILVALHVHLAHNLAVKSVI
jgi:hypothetical protein